MFGLEKSKNRKHPLVFDLEKDLQDSQKQNALMKKVEKHIQELKTQLRAGAKSDEFERLGLLLHGYSALLKVITQTVANK